jgi:hypothetical protein
MRIMIMVWIKVREKATKRILVVKVSRGYRIMFVAHCLAVLGCSHMILDKYFHVQADEIESRLKQYWLWRISWRNSQTVCTRVKLDRVRVNACVKGDQTRVSERIEQILYECEKSRHTARHPLNQSYGARALLIQSEC